jgi:hypothetical protein
MTSATDPDAARDAAVPVVPPERDFLGRLCFFLHFAVMLYIVTGWLAPWHGLLVFYLVFVPAVALQWWFNRNACVLNNLETLIRTGRWRDPANIEEGAWLLTLVRSIFGRQLKPWHMDAFTYAVLATVWIFALVHLTGGR